MLYLPLSVNQSTDLTESDDQPNVKLSDPILTPPILIAWSDDYFEVTFTVTNNWLEGGQHTFRVYAYLDYVRPGTGSGNEFHDGASVKNKGPYDVLYDPPYETIPFSSEMDPDEDFMGSERQKILSHHGQLTSFLPVPFTASCDNPLSPDHTPGNINLIIQILWRKDTFDVYTEILGIWVPWMYNAHFYWKTFIFDEDFLTRNMEIYDDDPDPPVIPTETAFPLPFDPIELPPLILDNMPTFPLEVCAYDLGTSGHHPYNAITFDSVNVYNGEYLSGQDELIVQDPWGNEIYAYWYKYDIPNNFAPGSHTVELKVWDKDNDGWAGDRLPASRQVTFTVEDDDDTKPTIDYEYTGDGTDGNPGEIIVTASDTSGLFVDPSGTYKVERDLGTQDFYFTATDNDFDNKREDDRSTRTIHVPIEIVDDDILGPEIEYIYTGDGTDGNSGAFEVTALDPSGLSVDPTGTYPVSNILGTYDFTFIATDNDTDREGVDDTSTTTLEISKDIVDDDIEEPYFENIDITDDCNWLNISFHGLDELLGDDIGLSLIEIFVDDELIHSYFPSPTDTIFDFGFVNKWIWEVTDEFYSNGQITYEVRVKITDADYDRVGDELTAEFIRYFEVTLDEMYDYVIWLLGEVNEYIYDNGLVALYGTVTQKLVKVQDILVDAYQLIEAGALHTGLVRNKIAEAKLEIAEAKAELKSLKGQVGDPYTSEILSMMHNIRNKIVELMGRSVGTGFSHDISLVEIEVYNLRDFVEDNINATDSENLVNAITLTAEKLENAIFDISLDKSTEGSLTSAQNALDNAKTVVVDLARKGKISEELKLELLAKIIILQGKIELLKLNI